MKKNNNFTIVYMFIIGMLVGSSLFILSLCIYNNYFGSNVYIDEIKENEIIQNGNSYQIILNKRYININEVVKWNESDISSEDVKYSNVLIQFQLKEMSSTLELNNIPSNAFCSMDNKVKRVILNDKEIMSFEHEGCYLIDYYSIFILNNEYVGIYYGSIENPLKSISIFDLTGNEVFISNKVVDFNITNYSYKTYSDEDENKMLDIVKLEVKDGEIKERYISAGSESYCDMLCEGEKCC